MRRQVQLSSEFERRLLAYAAAATAAGVGLAAPQAAEARIVYTPAHVQLNPNRLYSLDVDHNGTVDFFLLEWNYSTVVSVGRGLEICHRPTRFSTNWYFCSSTTRPEGVLNQVVVTKAKGQAATLRDGERIEKGEQFGSMSVRMGQEAHPRFSSSGTVWFGPWVNGGKGVENRYLGLKFRIDGKFHFGWARLTVKTYKRNFTTTLTGYAYETVPGKGIVAGQTKDDDVPASSLGSLALGQK